MLIVCPDFNAFIYIICWCSVINQMFSANCSVDGVRRSMVGGVLLVWGWGGGGGGGQIMQKTTSRGCVCFNADSVPAEAAMLI